MSISVVIPSYNHEPYVGACIASALSQTLPPDEIIVVDDGSTDGSREVIESFGRSICAVFQANRGTYATLNAAIARASSDWIAIHNSDDAWEPARLARQAALIEAHPEVGLVHTNFDCIDANSARYPSRPPEVPDFHGDPVMDMLPIMLHTNPVIISSTLISRKALERVGPFEERYHGAGDWDLCLRISRDFPFGYVDEPLTLVRKHPTNSSTDAERIPADWTTQDWQILGREKMPVFAQLLFERAQTGQTDRDRAAFALVCLATVYSGSREPDLARRVYQLSARLQPLRLKTYLRYAATFLPYSLRHRLA